jgi:hypothetical protein
MCEHARIRATPHGEVDDCLPACLLCHDRETDQKTGESRRSVVNNPRSRVRMVENPPVPNRAAYMTCPEHFDFDSSASTFIATITLRLPGRRRKGLLLSAIPRVDHHRLSRAANAATHFLTYLLPKSKATLPILAQRDRETPKCTMRQKIIMLPLVFLSHRSPRRTGTAQGGLGCSLPSYHRQRVPWPHLGLALVPCAHQVNLYDQ